MVQKRGRKSAEDMALTVAEPSAIHVIPRPDAPLDLTPEEAEVWNQTVDAMPADWFRPETFPLLSQWCRHTVKELLGMQARETTALKAMASAMRLSQQSSYSDRGAAGKKAARPKVKRLWD